MTKVKLNPHFDDYVREAVESGRYSDVSEVVQDALRLHEQRENAAAAAIASLKAETEIGLRDLNSGRVHAVRDHQHFKELTEPTRE